MRASLFGNLDLDNDQARREPTGAALLQAARQRGPVARMRTRAWSWSALLLVVTACSDPSSGEEVGVVDGAGGAAASTPAASTPAATTPASSVDTTPTSSAASVPAPTNTSPPTLCGGAYARECGEGQYCRFDSGCGTVGDCMRVRDNCDQVDEPVCGCDGQTHSNSCVAGTLGVSPQTEAECGATEQQFTCGPYRCEPGYFCLDKGGRDAIWNHVCLALPETCSGLPSCDCVGEQKSCFGGQTCQATAASVTVLCD
jgi:hypothetical protein